MPKKLKPFWTITDIPKNTKIKLWRLMKDNPTYQSWEEAITGKSYTTEQDKIFTNMELGYIKTSKDTYSSLKNEVMLMPVEEVKTLPQDLQQWIFGIRADLKGERGETQIDQKPYEETPHKRKMRELAKALAGRISLPSLFDEDLWRDLPAEFQPGKYSLPIGVVEIGEDRQIKVNYCDVGAGVAVPHLVEGLYSHLSTSWLSGFAELVGHKGKLDNWVSGVGQYSEALLRFLKLIVDEVKGYRDKVSFRDEAKPGLTKWFIVTAWNDVIQKASGYSGIDDSWYHPPESIPNTSLWQQKCGAYRIGIAKTKRRLKTYENWHKQLREKYTEEPIAKGIGAKYQELSNTTELIRQRLQEFSDMERLPGNCELC